MHLTELSPCHDRGSDHAERPRRRSDLRRPASLLVVAALLGSAASCAPAGLTARSRPAQVASCRAIPETQRVAAWKQFRAIYPLHIQGIAQLKIPGSECTYLVVAEPPPGTTPQDLVEAAAPFAVEASGGEVAVYRHRLGQDGFVRDAVLTLLPTRTEDRYEVVDRLHFALYGTTFGSYLLPTDPPAKDVGRLDTDVPTRPVDVAAWVLNAHLRDVRTEEPVSVEALTSGRQEGIFRDQQAGLVVWAMRSPGLLDGRGADVRTFTVAADIVLGAYFTEPAVLIVGRSRVVPVETLPPLRVECVNLLAAMAGQEMQQSFARGHAVAGRLAGGRDWAPIFLSPELRDTELGSSLNLADQLLKSWSQDGQTSYANFSYPRPPSWPFHAPMTEELVGAASITFNWNSFDFATVEPSGSDGAALALNHTGSVGVTYLAEGHDTSKLERIANAYFPAQGDPLLTRVAAYSALHIIFTYADIGSRDGRVEALSSKAQEDYLAEVFSRLIEQLGAASDPEMERYVHGLAAEDLLPPGSSEADLLRAIRTLHRLVASSDARQRKTIASICVGMDQRDPRVLEPGLAEFCEYLQISRTSIDFDTFLHRYSELAPRRKASWVHTPSYVVSSNQRRRFTGGHNLAPIATIHEATNVAPRSVGKVLRSTPAPGRSIPLGYSAARADPALQSTVRAVEREARGSKAFYVHRHGDRFEMAQAGSSRVMQARSLPAILETVSRQTEAGQSVFIVTSGMSSSEVSGFARNVEMTMRGRKALALHVDKGAAELELSGLLAEPVDTSVGEMMVSHLGNGEYVVSIPVDTSGHTGPWVEVRTHSRAPLDDSWRRRFGRTIEKLFGGRHEVTPYDVVKEVQEELGDSLPADAFIEFRMGDIIQVFLLAPRAPKEAA
jgi:hypothetical protein